MKRSEKIWLIIAAVLVLAGTLCFVGVMSARHWDFASLSNVKYEVTEIDVTETFRNISVQTGTEDIEFLLSADGKCRAVFNTEESVEPVAEVKDGTLLITTKDNRKWEDHIGFSFGADPWIKIYLPETGYASLSVRDDTGKVTVPQDFTFESVDISADTGDIFCSASSSGAVRIGTDTGEIRIGNVSAGSMDLSVTTGDIEIRSASCTGDLTVNVHTGKTKISDVSCRKFTSKGNTGDLSMKNLIAVESISIERTTGDIRFQGCDAAELFIQTDTGDVEGTLLSEKVFFTQCDTGRVLVPESVTGGRCKIVTDTGNIEIGIGG